MSLTERTFNCWLPIVKGSTDKQGKRWIQGIASTGVRDLQGEVVVQKGIDVSYFLKHGYFNNDHKPGSENKVGEPTECKITKDGLWVKGFIYEGKKTADDIWEHITSLGKSGSSRRMGFSIEGKVIERNGSMIERCWIQDIAITPAPVNHTTFAEMAKSLASKTWNVEKALEAGNTVLATESLDEEVKDEKVTKGLTFSQAVDFIQKQEPSLSRDAAGYIATVIFDTLT